VGINETNQPALGNCIKVTEPDDGIFIEIEGLSPATSYSCYYMIYNDYPLWPAWESE